MAGPSGGAAGTRSAARHDRVARRSHNFDFSLASQQPITEVMAATLRPNDLVSAIAQAAASGHTRRDPLTGLADRRTWLEALATAAFLPATQAHRCAVTVLVADLDGVKMVNELLGRDAGDEMIRAGAEVLRRAAPEGALVARIGGDELGILVEDGRTSAEELLFAVRHAALPRQGAHGRPVPLSVGAASSPPFGSVEDALAAAEHHLLVDKLGRRAGRR